MNWLQWTIRGIAFLYPITLSAQFAFYDSLHGMYWSQIEPPSFEDFGRCQIVHEGLGYILGSAGALYEFEASRKNPWRRLPQPGPYLIRNFYALAKDAIWATVIAPQLYKVALYYWNGAAWSAVASPNVYNI